MNTVLTIAGSDSSSGAGIQADLKTIMSNGGYGLTCVTAITAQNTQQVCDVFPLDAHIVDAQLNALFDDFKIDVIKIGMLGTADIVTTVANHLIKFKGAIVVDPVLISSSDHPLLSDLGIEAMINHLLPLATLITPNVPEAEYLLSTTLLTESDVHQACSNLTHRFHADVLIKGGHRSDELDMSTDTLFYHDKILTFKQPRLPNSNVHGTGCTYASAIATHLAKGHPLPKAIKYSNEYLHHAIQSAIAIGHDALLIV